MPTNVDYIVVGQGLAGTCLAHHLTDRKQRIVIIDQQTDNSSSKVAAGLYNPITGRKMVLTWQARTLFDYAEKFYRDCEKKLNANFLHPKPIYRPFLSVAECNEWVGKSEDSSYSYFIRAAATSPRYENHIADQYGGLELQHCGHVDTKHFLAESRDYFSNRAKVIDEVFDTDQLQVEETAVRYQEFTAKAIIFCTGVDAIEGTFFGWLPFNKLKGELIEVECPGDFEVIYNRGVFIVPLPNGKYLVGSTYDNRDTKETITEKGKNTLEEKLRKLLKLQYKTVGQRYGFRPAMRDRRPVVGYHPLYRNVAVLNGLGTKGVTLAPYFGQHLCSSLVDKHAIDAEVDCARFWGIS